MQFSTLDELLLQRIDDLDDFTRKALHIASVLGLTFTLVEIIRISEHVLSIGEKERISHAKKIRDSLNFALEEGILDETDDDEVGGTRFRMQNLSLSAFPDYGKEEEEEKSSESIDILYQSDKCYQFCHDTWRQKILSLLLDSYKRDIHMHAAGAIESNIEDTGESDFHTKIKLFCHLKGSRNTLKAADLAICVGKNFAQLGLNVHSIRIYNDALDMWRTSREDENDNSLIAGFSYQVIDSIDQYDLTSIIKLLTAFGQALGTLNKKGESARAFEDALDVFKEAPISSEIKDRSIIFPIYSGLFFLLKFGGAIETSDEKAYEQNLVSNFVEETRLNGDPVHYSRALAMQGEFYSRQGEYDDALFCHELLKRTYDFEKHSALVVEAYASDRSAQNYGNAANCLYRLGRVEEAIELSEEVLCDLIPRMDLKNVHSSMILLYPILWVWKNERMPKKALSTLEQYVFEPFRMYFGAEGKTICLCLYKPLEVLFSILMYIEGEVEELDETLLSWALEADLSFSISMDNAMSNFALCCSTITAEICLLLSKHTNNDQVVRKRLIEKGWPLAQVAMETATKYGTHQSSYIMTKPIYDEIFQLITELDEV